MNETLSVVDSGRPSSEAGLLRDILGSVIVEFFDSYGIPCAVAPTAGDGAGQPGGDGDGSELGAVISLRGRGVHGGLVFVAPVDLVARLLPVPDTGACDRQVRDWCSEIANQLLGRLKNKLAAYSIDFDVGVPVCFSGKSIRLVFVPDADGISLEFAAVSSKMRVHLDCLLQPGALSQAREPGAGRVASEGDVMLF